MGHHSTKLSQNQLRSIADETHLGTHEIRKLHSRFIKDYPKGTINREQLADIYRRYYKSDYANKFSSHVFRVFDTNKDGQIDFQEFIRSLTVAIKGDAREQLRWAFAIYDVDGNGLITEQELLAIVQSIRLMAGCTGDRNTSDAKVSELFKACDVNNDGVLSIDEFIRGSKKNPALVKLLQDYISY